MATKTLTKPKQRQNSQNRHSGGSFFAYKTLRERASCQREQRDFVRTFEIFCVIAKFVAFWDDTA
ncbi:MAG: hypothetical protein V7L11_18475 [Nostoc sp.]|uniref:hypothetical protein n=1 Tax=Nostoc sp. TaxID=1180 RepID=UPI002FF74100